jgi:hypothetical protein
VTILVPNTIRISTHKVDFSHPMARIWGEKSKSPMEPPQSEQRRRKEERKSEGRKRKEGEPYSVGESHHGG